MGGTISLVNFWCCCLSPLRFHYYATQSFLIGFSCILCRNNSQIILPLIQQNKVMSLGRQFNWLIRILHLFSKIFYLFYSSDLFDFKVYISKINFKSLNFYVLWCNEMYHDREEFGFIYIL